MAVDKITKLTSLCTRVVKASHTISPSTFRPAKELVNTSLRPWSMEPVVVAASHATQTDHEGTSSSDGWHASTCWA
jgi:hypothetical protein